MPIFRVKSVKIYTRQFFYTDTVCGVCDKYQVWDDGLLRKANPAILVEILSKPTKRNGKERKNTKRMKLSGVEVDVGCPSCIIGARSQRREANMLGTTLATIEMRRRR